MKAPRLMVERVVQCGNGHTACGACQEQAPNPAACGVCRWEGTMAPCRYLERVIGRAKFGCPRLDWGCAFTGSSSELAAHRTVCSHQIVLCPVCRLSVQLGRCAAHMEVAHTVPSGAAEEEPHVAGAVACAAPGLPQRICSLQIQAVEARGTEEGSRGVFVSPSCVELERKGGVLFVCNAECYGDVLSFCLVHVDHRDSEGRPACAFQVSVALCAEGAEALLGCSLVRSKDFWASTDRASPDRQNFSETSKRNFSLNLGALGPAACRLHVSACRAHGVSPPSEPPLWA
jgi:hypothetical protein